jgi:hypothetical protein
MFEEFDLPQALLRRSLGLVWPTQVFSLLRQHFVALFYFPNHDRLQVSFSAHLEGSQSVDRPTFHRYLKDSEEKRLR